MRLYIVKRRDKVGYDESGGAIIRAKTGMHARQIASEELFPKGEIWLDEEKVICSRLDEDGLGGVVLEDFRAG